MESIYIGISNATIFVSIAIAIFAAFIYPKIKNLFHLFLVYIIIGGSLDLISTAFAEYKMNNLKFIHLYTFLEFGVLSVFFNQLTGEIRSRIDLKWIYLPVLGMFVLNTCFLQGLEIHNSYSATLGSIVILGYCIYTFYLMLDFPNDRTLSNIKWLVVGVFITHSGVLIIMFSSNMIMDISSDYKLIIWIIRSIILFITKILYLVILIKVLQNANKLILNGGR